MFSKRELELAKRIVPDQKFLKSKAGQKAAMEGIEDAIKDTED